MAPTCMLKHCAAPTMDVGIFVDYAAVILGPLLFHTRNKSLHLKVVTFAQNIVCTTRQHILSGQDYLRWQRGS
eukprot:3704197-Amphidinium_carterae.1